MTPSHQTTVGRVWGVNYENQIANPLTLQFQIRSLTCRCLGVCAILMGLFMYKELPTRLWFGRIRLLLCIYEIKCGRKMNEGLLDQKTAGVEVSAKLCDGDMTASIPVIWQLATAPPKKALRYQRWESMRKTCFSSWAVRTKSFSAWLLRGKKKVISVICVRQN